MALVEVESDTQPGKLTTYYVCVGRTPEGEAHATLVGDPTIAIGLQRETEQREAEQDSAHDNVTLEDEDIQEVAIDLAGAALGKDCEVVAVYSALENYRSCHPDSCQ